MTKQEIKKILMSLRNTENQFLVDNLLGRLDIMDDNKVAELVRTIGDNPKAIEDFLRKKLADMQNREGNSEGGKFTPLNDFFQFGTTSKSIHLHMPVKFEDIIKRKDVKGTTNAMNLINLYLLDAIDRIITMQKNGESKLTNSNCIYMISPILLKAELEFLKSLDFKVASYSKKFLGDAKFVSDNPEAQLAVNIFGSKHTVGTATISLDKVKSDEWQKKKKQIVAQLRAKGFDLVQEEER